MINKKELITKLKLKKPDELNMLLGFDGAVDEIIHVVDKRQSTTEFTKISTISDFAKRIEKASGLSTNIEWISTQTKLGGNGPIMANALIKHGVNLTYIGTVGSPHIHEVFNPLVQRANVLSIGKFVDTQALEFNDGKLIIGKMNDLITTTYESILKVISEEELIDYFSNTDFFASLNWSMFPYMTEIWNCLINNILPKTKVRVNKPLMFVDLADPEKREDRDIILALKTLKGFKSHFKVALGLNKKEAYDVTAVLGLIDKSVVYNESLETINKSLYDYLDLDFVVIHPVDCSSVCYKNRFYTEVGPYTEKPKLTTGAGDNFNAGFTLGILLDLEPNEALVLGMATSGYYVRNAASPDYASLIQFIENWL